MAERPLSTISGDTIMAIAANIPLPPDDGSSFHEPRAPYMVSDPFSDSPRESYLNATPNDSGTLLAAAKNENYVEDPILTTPSPKSKRRVLIIAGLLLVALILIVVAVIVPVYFTVIKHQSSRSTKVSGGSGASPTPGGQSGPTTSPGSSTNSKTTTGGDGSTIYAADGSTFTYNNKFGGFCKCFAGYILCIMHVFEFWPYFYFLPTTDHIISRGCWSK